MCEFKIIRKSDDSQILEDIVVLSYTEDNQLLCTDILGMGEILESALIFNVNTLNQTCEILQHTLVKDFIKLMKDMSKNSVTENKIEDFKMKLENLKSELK